MEILREVKDTVYALNGKLYKWNVTNGWRISSYRLLGMCNIAFEEKYGLFFIIKNRYQVGFVRNTLIFGDVESLNDYINSCYNTNYYNDNEIHYINTVAEAEEIEKKWQTSLDKH